METKFIIENNIWWIAKSKSDRVSHEAAKFAILYSYDWCRKFQYQKTPLLHSDFKTNWFTFAFASMPLVLLCRSFCAKKKCHHLAKSKYFMAQVPSSMQVCWLDVHQVKILSHIANNSKSTSLLNKTHDLKNHLCSSNDKICAKL